MPLDNLVACLQNNTLNPQHCIVKYGTVQILLLLGSQQMSLPTLAINKQNSLNVLVVTGHAPLHFRGSEVKSQHRNYLTRVYILVPHKECLDYTFT